MRERSIAKRTAAIAPPADLGTPNVSSAAPANTPKCASPAILHRASRTPSCGAGSTEGSSRTCASVASIVVGSAIVMSAGAGPQVGGYSVLGLLGFIVAGVLGLAWAVIALKSGKL